MANLTRRLTGAIATLALLCVAMPRAMAASDDFVEEIIVTATHRDTAMMDTALTISALTEEVLIDKGVVNIQTLYQSIPGLAYRTNSNTYNTISVRGITPPGGGGAAVGVYIDEVPITDGTSSSGNAQVAGALFDLARVEVLKGPQGTLYGEGNLGGALRYITNDADPNNWDFKIRGIVEDVNESDDLGSRVDGLVNVPIVPDRLGLRVSGWYRDNPGILDISGDPEDYRRNADDVDSQEEWGIRGKALWTITDAFDVSLMANYVDADYEDGPANAEFAFGSNTVFNDAQFENGGSDEQTQVNVTLRYALPFADMSFSSSYYDRDVKFSEETTPRFAAPLQLFTNLVFGDLTGLPPEALADPRAIVLALGGDNSFSRRSERYVQELRLVSSGDGPWQWVAGLYYKDDESINGRGEDVSIQYTMRPEFEFLRPFIDPFYVGVVGLCCETELKTEELAAYGEISYAFNEQWELLLGLRASNISKELKGQPDDVDDNMYSPKVTLSWRPQDGLLIYGTVAQGFRPGVINEQVILERDAILAAAAAGMPFPGGEEWLATYGGLTTANGDEVMNYELGVKTTLFDNRMSFVGSLYYIDWQDTIVLEEIPRVTPNPAVLTADLDIGDAESSGIEIETTYAVTDRLMLTLGGDWNWTAEINTDATGQFQGVAVESGNRLANAPDYSINASASYTMPLWDGWEGDARLDFYRVDKSYNRATNEQETPGYHQFNLKYIMTSPSRQWRVALFVDNLDDEEIIYEHNEVGFRFGRPRTIGLDLSYSLSGR